MRAFSALFKSEARLALRGIDMFIFAICMPVVVVVILGAIFGDQAAFEGASYSFLDQSFGAVSTIAICAGGVMGLPLVISDYRNRKILKRYQVTPISPALILLVQVMIYALFSIASLVLIYLAASLFFGFRLHGSWPIFLATYGLVMFSMFSIGVLVGGLAPDVKTAGAIASLLYFPMLIFSGATLPYEVMPTIFQRIADVMPLTQGIKLLKAASLGLPLDSVAFPIGLLVALMLVCCGISLRFFRWE
jgi:ABC-2 type transport system permease protein